MKDTTEVSRGTVEMVKPVEAANWTGLELIPFETIAERFLDLDEEGKQETLTVAFGRPFVIEGKGKTPGIATDEKYVVATVLNWAKTTTTPVKAKPFAVTR